MTTLGTLLRRDNVRLIAVATAFAVIGLSAPAVSHGVQAQLGLNADKVDGKDAVGYSSPASKRKGKLVATHPRTGQLPSGAMAKAPDSSRLAGLPSSSYTARKAKSGQVLTGVYAVTGETVGGLMATGIDFSSALPTSLAPSQVSFIPQGNSTTACPGPGRVVPRGHLCVYEAGGSDRTEQQVRDPSTGSNGASRTGFLVWMRAIGAAAFSYGTWAVKAR